MRRFLVLFLTPAVVLGLVACGNDDDAEANEPTATDVATTADATPTEAPATATAEPTAEPTPTEAAPDGTSRDTPVPIGTPVEVAGWTITVVSVTPDATDAVLAENQFNDPPEEGHQFFMASLTATYEGEDDSVTLFGSVTFRALGASNVAYGPDAWCGVIPDGMDTFAEVFQGGTVTGNVCWSVEAADADGLVMMIDEFLGSQRVWLSLSQ